jgi:hypothetical protein
VSKNMAFQMLISLKALATVGTKHVTFWMGY